MFLGVDGGGTKTAYALVDAHGNVRASHVTASVSHLAAGVDAAAALLQEGMRATFAAARIAPADVRFAFFGLSSHGEDSSVVAQLDAMPSSLLEPRRYACGNDMLGSWAGSLACADGISVIAGTGSMAYGEWAGRGARAGGWGELIGDEGSAYWIAREGFTLFTRMSDGRAPRGPLYELVRRRFSLSADLDLSSHVYGVDANTRAAFAQFARVVHEAAEAGDAAAQGIFTAAARELAALVLAVRRTLAVPDIVPLPVSWTGGAFSGSARLVEAFRHELASAAVPFEPRTPLLPPVLGAALYAARLGGAPLGPTSIERLRSQVANAGLPS